MRARRLRNVARTGLLLVLGWCCNAGAQAPIDPEVISLSTVEMFDFGAFCISDIAAGQITRVGPPRITPEGQWREFTITVKKDAPKKPRLYLFRDLRKTPGSYTECRATLPQGVTRIIQGTVRFGTLNFRMLVRPTGDRAVALQIEDDQLDLNLVGISSNFNPLYGGSVVPDGNELRITNVGEFEANQKLIGEPSDNVLSGVLRVGSTQLRLTGADVLLPGSSNPLDVNFSTTKGVALDVAVPSGSLTLHKGTFTSGRISFPKTPLRFAGVATEDAVGTIARISLTGQEGRSEPLAEMHQLSLTATAVVHDASPYAHVTPSGPVTVGKLAGLLSAERATAAIPLPAAIDVKATRAALRMGGSPESPGITGSGDLQISRIDATSIDGVAAISEPVFAHRVVPLSDVEVRTARIEVHGAKETATISGTADLSRARLSTLDLRDTTQVVSTFQGNLGPGEIAIPFRVDTAAPTGRWAITDPTGATITLEGTLKRLAITGTLYVAPALEDSRVEVTPGSLTLSVAGSAVRRSLVFGVPAERTEISAALEVTSPAGFVVRRAGATGSVHVTTDVLLAHDPQLVFDAPDGSAFEIQAPVRFDTGATVGIDLATVDVSLVRGRAALQQIGARSITNAPARIADMELTAASLTLASLALSFDNGRGTVRGTGLEFAAAGIRHLEDPIWELDAPNPRIPSFEASLGNVMTGIVVEDARVFDIRFTAANGRYESKDGFVVNGQAVTISADELTEEAITNGLIAVGSGSVELHFANPTGDSTGSTTFSDFRVTATGTKERLSGTGSIVLDDLRVSHTFPIITDECQDRVRLRANAGLGRLAVNVQLLDSALTGAARGGRLGVAVKETGHDSCEFRKKYSVDVVKTVSRSVCWFDLFDKICDLVTEHIKVRVDVPVLWRVKIHNVHIPAEAESFAIQLHSADGVGVCINNVKAKTTGRIQHAVVYPTFDARGDLAELVKKTFEAAMEATIGLAETAILNTATNLLGLITEIASPDFCSK